MPDVSNEGLQPDGNLADVEGTNVPDAGETDAEDAGRTTGGGSLGHDQPGKVRRDTPVRNASGAESDPVMPADDATLNTKI